MSMVKTQGSMEFITLRPLVVSSLGATTQGLLVINSVDPCVLKSNYYVCTGVCVCVCACVCVCVNSRD